MMWSRPKTQNVLCTRRCIFSAAASVLLLVAMTGCGTTAPPPSKERVPWPSPVAGPGTPSIQSTAERAIERAVFQLEEGRVQKARSLAEKAFETAQGELFELQISLSQGNSGLVPEIERIVDEHPRYAAAWITLSFAAELEQLEETALRAANTGADLWPAATWKRRAKHLYSRWVEDRVEAASQGLDGGEIEEAIEIVEKALALDPENRPGQLLKANSLIELGAIDEAEILLASLGSDTEAIWLAGRIAEERSDWLTAMDLYQSLPAEYPDALQARRRARINWRLQHMPSYVQEAIRSEELTREGLAVLVVALAPDAEMVASRPIPVLPDIVDLESQREILTAVRSGLIETDPLEPRFDPTRPINHVQLRASINRLSALLGAPIPIWCDESEGVISSSCISVPERISGQFVMSLVFDLLPEQEE